MITWIWILGAIYLGTLGIIAYTSWRDTDSAEEYILAGSNVGAWLGLLTYAATLFSTFTLMGMPDFFRNHGIGAWIFLAVSDGAQVFFIVWFGYHLRKKAQARGFRGTAGLISSLYETAWAGYLYFAGVFLFLIPYAAIQVRGLAVFLEAVFPGALPAWVWSAGIVAIMLIYSEVGGFRAIMYSDALQGLTLLIVTWVIAVGCIKSFGGVGAMFDTVQNTNSDLLSIPGPQGLFSRQFLIASFFAVLLLPATQPHLTTRLMAIRDRGTMNRMAVSIGCFAILIILPVIAIGMFGSVHLADATAREFWAEVLLFGPSDFIGAAAVIGLLTAAMSTADAQIFALGTELRSLMDEGRRHIMRWTRIAIGFFGVAVLIFSIVSSDQLALLARVSFAGTALLAPMILAGVLGEDVPGPEVPVATGFGLAIFLLSLLGAVPEMVAGVRMDLGLLVLLAVWTGGSYLLRRSE